MDPLSASFIGQYALRGPIGHGAFSTVCLCQSMKTGKFFACKIVERAKLLSHDFEARFENEIRINQQIHHPGVVALFDLLKDETSYYIVMEFCPNGELFSHVVDKERLDETEAKYFILQILYALQYVHSIGICHRDLKPENLLLDQEGHVKISDFGLSRFVGSDNIVSTPCGSPCYASPECVSGRPYDGKISDVWSCGVISYAILTGQLPWTKRNQQQLFEQIKRGDYVVPRYLSDSCRSFITGLMTVDPEHRMTIEQALRHPWLSGMPPPSVSMYGDSHCEEDIHTPSLRKLDVFFGKEISFDDSDSSFNLIQSGLASSQTFDSIRKALESLQPTAFCRQEISAAPSSSSFSEY